MITLRELEATFIRYEKGVAGPGHGRKLPDGSFQYGGFEIDVQRRVSSLAEAQGIVFLCPKCFQENGGAVGTHYVHVSFASRGIPDGIGTYDSNGNPSRWEIHGGTCLDDLILSPSILLSNGCQWHGFIGMNGASPGCAI